MEENKESSSCSSKHQNSDLEDCSSSNDNENKLIESTGVAEDALDYQNKISGETEDPLIDDKISGEAENPLTDDKISGEAVIHNKIPGEAGDLLIDSKICGEVQDLLIQNKTSGDASPTSFSSSSHLLEIDYDENAFDISFSISEEDEEISNTRQWSMVSASPPTAAVQDLPLSPENIASPKQSPVVQVMERTNSYDQNRIPASAFSRKSTNTTEWSADSSDSLFSLHLGRSGELNRADSSFHLPPVIETTSEIDQKSTIGEIQKQSDDVPAVVHANENGVNPSCDSNTTPPPPPPPAPPVVPAGNMVAALTKPGNCVPIPKARCRCFNCFSCCTFCG